MIDWKGIQTEYITGELSLVKLAKKHSLPLSTVQVRCRQEGWVAKRRDFRQQAVAVAVSEAVTDEADRLGKIITSAQRMSVVIEDVFKDGKQFYRHVVQDEIEGEKTTIEKIFDKADSKAIRDMTAALKDMTLVLRNLYNLPTQAEAEAQRIAAERLKLEQQKAAAADNTDKKITVVMEGGWEDLAK